MAPLSEYDTYQGDDEAHNSSNERSHNVEESLSSFISMPIAKGDESVRFGHILIEISYKPGIDKRHDCCPCPWGCTSE